VVGLREIRESDKQLLLGWRNLPEVAEYMYSDHVIKQAEHDKWFKAAFDDRSKHYWIITLDSEDVGLANIYNIDLHNRRCYWAFYLASPSVRGRGVGSFVEYSVLRHVFDEMGLNKLCCEVLGFNEPVVRMHQSFGFRQEGTFREHIFKQGTAHDVICMAILRDEWAAAKPQIEERLSSKGLI
jgi:UDP-4-amino-4,6-dideoxy-N-acetyl-beta-L-altrosamine N-acetyltransferase